MKKYLLIILLSLSFLGGCFWNKDSVDSSNATTSVWNNKLVLWNRPVDKEYIKNLLKDNYYPKYHTLELRNKALKYLPDLCKALTW